MIDNDVDRYTQPANKTFYLELLQSLLGPNRDSFPARHHYATGNLENREYDAGGLTPGFEEDGPQPERCLDVKLQTLAWRCTETGLRGVGLETLIVAVCEHFYHLPICFDEAARLLEIAAGLPAHRDRNLFWDAADVLWPPATPVEDTPPPAWQRQPPSIEPVLPAADNPRATPQLGHRIEQSGTRRRTRPASSQGRPDHTTVVLRPTAAQRASFVRYDTARGMIWDRMIQIDNAARSECGKFKREAEKSAALPALRRELAISDVPAQVLQKELHDYEKALVRATQRDTRGQLAPYPKPRHKEPQLRHFKLSGSGLKMVGKNAIKLPGIKEPLRFDPTTLPAGRLTGVHVREQGQRWLCVLHFKPSVDADRTHGAQHGGIVVLGGAVPTLAAADSPMHGRALQPAET